MNGVTFEISEEHLKIAGGVAIGLLVIICTIFGIIWKKKSKARHEKEVENWYRERVKKISSGRLYKFKGDRDGDLICPLCAQYTRDYHKVYFREEDEGRSDAIENGLSLFRWHARCNHKTCGYEWVMKSRLEETI
jgi:hypothetical protein